MGGRGIGRAPRPARSLGRAGGLVLLAGLAAGCVPAPEPLPEPALYVVLAGQSNMAGVFAPAPADTVATERVRMYHPERGWVPARERLHPAGGVGPGLAAGRALAAARPGVTVGLIPCAVGGSSVADWAEGPRRRWLLRRRYGPHVDTCTERVRRATGGAPADALLWHQGESEAVAGRRDYAAQAGPFLRTFARRIGARCVLGGELVDVDAPAATSVRAAQRELFGPGLVWAADLPLSRDAIHLTRSSARELGRRYAAALLAGQCAPSLSDPDA